MIAPGIDDLPGQIDELNLNVSIIWSSVPLLFVTLIVVGLRLWARKIKGLSFGLDDWLIIICVPLLIAIIVCEIWGVAVSGLGDGATEVVVLDPHTLNRVIQVFFAVGWIYIALSTITKLSILAMYRRIFPNAFVFLRRGIVICTVATLLFFIGTIVTIALQCQPLQKVWDTDIPGTCLDFGTLSLSNVIPNIIIDFGILLLPIYEISQLSMRLPQKLGIASIFLLGIFIPIVSGIRMIFLIQMYQAKHRVQVYRSMAISWILTVVEGECAVLCACLPLLRPVTKKLFGRFTLFNNLTLLTRFRYGSRAHHEPKTFESGVITIGGSGGSRRYRSDTGGCDPFAHYTEMETGLSTWVEDANIECTEKKNTTSGSEDSTDIQLGNMSTPHDAVTTTVGPGTPTGRQAG